MNREEGLGCRLLHAKVVVSEFCEKANVAAKLAPQGCRSQAPHDSFTCARACALSRMLVHLLTEASGSRDSSSSSLADAQGSARAGGRCWQEALLLNPDPDPLTR